MRPCQVVAVPEAALVSAAEPATAVDGEAAAAEPANGGAAPRECIQIVETTEAGGSTSNGDGDLLLELQGLTLRTPTGSNTLVRNLDLQVPF